MKSIVIKRCTVQQLKSSNFKVSFSTLQVEKNKNFTSESESHFYTKRTLYENLLKLEPKNRQIHLKTPCNQEGKLWLCKTQFVKERWCEAWNTVKEEFSLKEAGFRFDVALLFDNFVYKVTDIPSHDESLAEGIFYLRSIYNQDISNKIITWCKKIKEFVDDPKNKDEVLRIPTLNSYERKILHNYGSRLNINHESEGVSPFRELLIKRKKKLEVSGLVVLEILATSKMASSKLNWLHQNTIPWAEISVNSTLSPAWNPNEPIEVIESSEKWICEECQFQLQNHLQLNNVVAVIDKYFYNGVRHRYFYFLFESEISPAHSNKEYFLIKTGYHTFESSTEKGFKSYLIGREFEENKNSLFNLVEQKIKKLETQKDYYFIDYFWGEQFNSLNSKCIQQLKLNLPRTPKLSYLFPIIDFDYPPKFQWNILKKWNKFI